jgi:peptidoglycan hydrolase-like protein with peptidoglycan-binding domain
MIWLSKGDIIPSVTLVQEALNTAFDKKNNKGVSKRDDKEFGKLTIDGHFGGNTEKLVIAFQKAKGLDPDGIVGPNTWGKLKEYSAYQIVDFIDTNDEMGVTQIIDQKLRKFGSKPIKPKFLSNAMESIGKKLPELNKKQKIGIFRIFSHGNTGHQNLSKGLGGYYLDTPPVPGVPRSRQCAKILTNKAGRQACVYPSAGGQGLRLGARLNKGSKILEGPKRDHFEDLYIIQRYWTSLRGCFGNYGSVELHGCGIGMGTDGRDLIAMLALFLGVPVVATKGKHGSWQTTKKLLRVEKPWRISYPLGLDIKSWAGMGNTGKSTVAA